MYLKNIRLDHWGCHDDLQTDFHEGLNVCVGRNGAGKSTLYNAIFAALTIKHDATGQRVAGFKSWGKDGFGPTATLEIVRDEVVWKLTKSYLFEPRCLLERNGGQTPYKAKGKVAEQELDGWLEGDGAAGRLILTLWSNQNDPIQIFQPFPAGAKTPSPGAWVDQILARVGRPEAAGPFASVKKGVAERYMARITPTKMDVKKGSDLDLAAQECAKAGQGLAELQTRGRDLADKASAFKVRSARHAEDCDARDGLRRRREELVALESEYRTKAETAREADGHAAKLRECYESMKADNAQLADAERARAEFEARLAKLKPALEEAGRVFDAAECAFRDAERRYQSSRPLLDDLASCFERRNLLEAAVRLVRSCRDGEDSARGHQVRAVRTLGQAAERFRTSQEESTRASQSLAAARRRRSRRDLRAAEVAYRQAEADHRRASESALVAEREGLRDLLEKLRAWSTALAALDPSGDGGPVPSAGDWQSLRDEDQRLGLLERGLAADSLTFRLVASVPLQARLSGEGLDPEVRDLAAGGAFEGQGVGSFSIEIEGVGRLEVGRAAGEPSARMEALREGRASFSARLAALGASKVDELEARRRREDERRGLEERISSHLGSRTLAELEARHAELDVELETFDAGSDVPASPRPQGEGPQALRRRMDLARETLAVARAACEADGLVASLEEDVSPMDPAEAGRQAEHALVAMKEAEDELMEAKLAEAHAGAEIGFARDRREHAERRLAEEAGGDDPDGALALVQSRIDEVRSRLEPGEVPSLGVETRASVQGIQARLGAELDRLRKAHHLARETSQTLDADHRLAEQGLADRAAALRQLRERLGLDEDPEARAEALRARHEQWHKASALAGLRREALPDDPAVERAALEGRWEEAEDHCRAGDFELIRLRTELEVMGADGLDTQLALAEEHFERCKARLDDLGRDAAAWALLHHLLEEEETRQSRDVAARVQSLATDSILQLTGGNAGGVVFDPTTLAPVEVQVPRLGLSKSLEQFSRGTREQVALACRLQIGLLLSLERRRHMLLLDDPLAHTDAPRLGAALDVLAKLADQLQLIVFTCHEDRYRPLRGLAKFIEIG